MYGSIEVAVLLINSPANLYAIWFSSCKMSLQFKNNSKPVYLIDSDCCAVYCSASALSEQVNSPKAILMQLMTPILIIHELKNNRKLGMNIYG